MRCEEVRDHIASCADCQAECGEVDEVWQALGQIPAPTAPSSRMRERFSSALADERTSIDWRPASRPAVRRPRLLRLWPGEPLVQLALAA